MPQDVVVKAAVEGIVDELVVRRLLEHVGATAGEVYGKNGKRHVLQRLQGYNNAAQHAPWLVLIDLDSDAQCAPSMRSRWLPHPAPNICFRIALGEVEAWLLGDRERIASFLRIARKMVPIGPEAIDDPKSMMVSLALQSRRREIREDMAPRIGSGRLVGPAYSSRLVEFTLDH